MAGGRLVFVVCLAVAAALALASGGRAQGSCAQRLLLDWKDGKITGTYPTACYRQALATMPEDLRVYSSATDDIEAALQQHLRQAAHGTRSLAASAGAPDPARPSTSGWSGALAVAGMAGGAVLVLAAALGLTFRAGRRSRG